MIAEGDTPQYTVLKWVAKQGNIDNFWGNDFSLKRVQCEDNQTDGYFSPSSQAEFDEKIVAVPADGDIAVLYLRKDLLEDSADRRKRFKQIHGRQLSHPETWSQYQDLVEFCHRPEQGFYGTCEQRDLQTGWMFWMPRYVSQTYPNQLLFDDEMRPMINSAAGIAATGSYLKTISCSPPLMITNLAASFEKMCPDLKKREEELQISEARYRGLFEDSPLLLPPSTWSFWIWECPE